MYSIDRLPLLKTPARMRCCSQRACSIIARIEIYNSLLAIQSSRFFPPKRSWSTKLHKVGPGLVQSCSGTNREVVRTHQSRRFLAAVLNWYIPLRNSTVFVYHLHFIFHHDHYVKLRGPICITSFFFYKISRVIRYL